MTRQRLWRAAAALAWAAGWTLLWGLALLIFANKARAEPLSMAVSRGPVSASVFVAEARGFFAAEGLDLRLVDCRSGRDCYRALADGRVDLATASELVVITNSATRPDVAIVATLSTSWNQIRLVARRSAHIVETPQIRGARIGTVAGTSAQYFLDSWLVFNDIDPASITLVPLAPEALAPALDRRDVDAVAIWEPLASHAVALLGGDANVFPVPRVYTQHFNLLAGRPTLERRAADVDKLLRALIKAQRFIAEQPAAARALVSTRMGLDAASAAAILADQDFRVRLDQSLVTTMQSQARWAVHAGLESHARAADLLHVIDPAPLRRVAPAAVGLAY